MQNKYELFAMVAVPCLLTWRPTAKVPLTWEPPQRWAQPRNQRLE